MKHKVHSQPACLERLYLQRNDLGRGLGNAEFKAEQMLLELRKTLEESKNISTRRAAILKVEKDEKSHLSLIQEYLKIKYDLKEDVTQKSLAAAQNARLISEIEKKSNHQKLFRLRANDNIDVYKRQFLLS